LIQKIGIYKIIENGDLKWGKKIGIGFKFRLFWDFCKNRLKYKQFNWSDDKKIIWEKDKWFRYYKSILKYNKVFKFIFEWKIDIEWIMHWNGLSYIKKHKIIKNIIKLLEYEIYIKKEKMLLKS
jgi:hypothetical protein